MRSVEITGLKKDEKDVARIRFDHNALADLEERCGMGLSELMQKQMTIAATRLLLCYGLRHEDRGITTDRAGQMIQRYLERGPEGGGGTLPILFEQLWKAIQLSGVFKEEKDEASEDAEGNGKTDATGPGASGTT